VYTEVWREGEEEEEEEMARGGGGVAKVTYKYERDLQKRPINMKETCKRDLCAYCNTWRQRMSAVLEAGGR